MLAVPQLMPSYCPNLYWPQCIYSGDSIPSCSQRLRSYVEVIVLCIGYSAFTVAIPSYCPNLYWPQCIYSGDPILLSQFVLATVHLQWRSRPTVPICIGHSAFTADDNRVKKIIIVVVVVDVVVVVVVVIIVVIIFVVCIIILVVLIFVDPDLTPI